MVTRPNAVPVRRIITVSDVEGYGMRPHDDQRDLQNRIADIEKRAAVNGGLSLKGAITQPRGDGSLTAWPPETSDLDVIVDYLREFQYELARVNDSLSHNSKIRMRLAIAAGLVEEAAYGIPGQAAIRAALLADSHELREALQKARRHSLAVILDDRLYQDVVKTRLRGLRPEAYEKVVITDKYGEKHTAWVAIPRPPARLSSCR